MEILIEHNLAAFNEALLQYAKWCSDTPQMALQRKVDFLGKRIWTGFSQHEFGGFPRKRGVAKAELQTRTAEKRGTFVRASLLAAYQKTAKGLRERAKVISQSLRHFMGTLDQWGTLKKDLARNQNARINAWQAAVGREISLRQSGIGELAAAFRWSHGAPLEIGKRTVQNRQGKTMGIVEIGEGEASITAELPGVTTVDQRYAIVAQALADETDDTMEYVERKMAEKRGELFGGFV